MQRYEYKVVPAPDRGQKARGVKTPEARFAHAMTEALNALAADGWEYHRAETLPCAESKGFFASGKDTVYRSMLVFRRPLAEATATDVPSSAADAAPARQGAAMPAEASAAPTVPPAPNPAAPPPGRPRSRVLMAIPSARTERPKAAAEPAPAAPAPVLRADRGATAEDAGTPAGPVFRWPLRGDAAEPKPPRPVQRGDQG